MSESSSLQVVGNQTPPNIIYSIATKTSNLFSAGTDANVYIQLIGTLLASDRLELKSSINHRNKFERNHSDVFLFLNVPYLGELREVKIWHDNSGPSPSWHLSCVEIHESTSDMVYTFTCGRWLATNEDDGQICRKLSCTSKRKKVPKHYRMTEETSGPDEQKSWPMPVPQPTMSGPQQMMPQPQKMIPQPQQMMPQQLQMPQHMRPVRPRPHQMPPKLPFMGPMPLPPQMQPYPMPMVPYPVQIGQQPTPWNSQPTTPGNAQLA